MGETDDHAEKQKAAAGPLPSKAVKRQRLDLDKLEGSLSEGEAAAAPPHSITPKRRKLSLGQKADNLKEHEAAAAPLLSGRLKRQGSSQSGEELCILAKLTKMPKNA